MQSIFNNANHSLRSALPDSLRLQQPPAGSQGASGFAQVQRFPEFVSVLTSCWSKQESELSPGPDRKLQTQNSAWALQAGAFWKAGVFGGRDLNSCVDNTDNRDLIQAEGGYVKGGTTLKLKQQSSNEREERRITWVEMLLVWKQPQPRVPGDAWLAPASPASQRAFILSNALCQGCRGFWGRVLECEH